MAAVKLSKEEFMQQVKKDREEKNKRKDNDFYAYMKESRFKRKRGWNVKLGGFRY